MNIHSNIEHQNNPFYLKESGDFARSKNLLDDALGYYEAAIKLRPQYMIAHYDRGGVLSQQGRYLEAANAFMLAWLHGRFRPEPGLMCGRALVAAKFFLEACLMFDRIELRHFDPTSALYYADALRKEVRIRDALSLLPLIGERPHDPSWQRVFGDCYLQMNDLPQAAAILEAGRVGDPDGYMFDRLIAVHYAQWNLVALRALLVEAQQRWPENPYYPAQKAVLDIVEDRTPSLQPGFNHGREDLLEAAEYFKPYLRAGLVVTGTSYQTFDHLAKLVPSEGLILEFGVRNGHSIHHLAELFPSRTIYGFDSFEGLPESWYEEGAGSYSTAGRVPKVPQNVKFLVGWFSESLQPFKQAHPIPIAFMNVDCDLYSATKTIFDELDRQIVPGTVIVFDEYIGLKTWREDEFKAFQEWVAAHAVKYEYLTVSFYSKQVSVRILERN